MPIIVRNVPQKGADLLCLYITKLLREKRVPPGVPVEIRPEELLQAEPHPVFFVPLDALSEGKLLGAATHTSWRYLIVRGETAIAEAELSAKQRGSKGGSAKELEFLGLTQGPFTIGTIEALSAAEKLDRVAKADYELRLLKVPGVYLVALWLHGENDDLLIPIGDPPGGLKKNRPYSEGDVIKGLREIAAQTKRFHDSYAENQPKPRRKIN
jgi:hypothetical protein